MWTLEISWARKKKSAGRFFVSQKRRKPHLFLRLVRWKKNFQKIEDVFIKLISFSTCTIITKISDQNFLIKISENSLIISLIEDVQMEIQIKVTNLIPWFFKKWENWKKTRLSFFSFSKKISPVTIHIPAILPHYLTLPIFPLTG